MKSASEEAPLSRLSPLAEQKGFEAIAGTLKSTKRLRDGSFLVECYRKQQAENLLSAMKLVDGEIKVTVHKALNSYRGLIRCREHFDLVEREICAELKDQGVVEVRRVAVKKDGKVISTNTLFLMFNRPDLPNVTRVGYLQVKVDSRESMSDLSCPPIAMVRRPPQPKIALSGRRKRRFNVFALRNAYLFLKPERW